MAGTSRSNNKGKSTGRNTGKTGGRRTTPKTKNKIEENSFLRAEVIIICSFALSILLFLSNFGICGAVGSSLRSFQLGLFGIMGYAAQILIFAGIALYVSNRGNPKAVIKVAAGILIMLSICGFSQMIFGVRLEVGESVFKYYSASAENGAGGGLLGGLLVTVFEAVFGTIGAYLIMFVCLVIGLVCITEKSLVGAVKKGSNKAYRYAKEDVGRRIEEHAERQEERRRLREEQKVRGVNLNSTIINEPVSDTYEEYAEPEAAVTEEKVQSEMQADVFTGHIMPPVQISNDTDYEDTVPFDEEEAYGSLLEEIKTAPKNEEDAEEIFLEHDTRTLEEMNLISSDGAQKRIVTAGGKIIESDTDILQKKMEEKRAEASENGDLSPAVQIAEKEKEVKKQYIFPPIDLLKKGSKNKGGFSDKEYRETAIKLQQTLQNFGVGVTVTNISCGPSVTRYELHPEQGVKVSKIVGLTDDIKLNLAAADIRIEAPIPGKSAVGIEVPNKENNVVLLRDLLESDNFKKHPSRLAFAVGKDIGGQTVVTDIAKMPHLLIAGATGSGKSVCINTLIMSIIYKADPEDVKLIMVDPKVVELSVYNGIPHLLIPVVTDPKKASGALNWAVAEMTDRYKKFAEYNVRDLKGYNEKIKTIEDIDDENKPKKLPQIIIIVDELADLMMVAPGEVEDAICRLAQLARAAGIHLVIATQRPSVNVITGLIKANVPSRIAFSVSSGVDSRTIIDMNGAEKLLGKGDMLFYPSGYQKPQRVQGAFVSDSEVSKVVEFLTSQDIKTEYSSDIESKIAAPAAAEINDAGSDRDAYFVQAGHFIIEKEKASIGMLQRVFKIGFNRAARIMDQLAEAGVVGEEEGTKPRKVLMTREEFDEVINNAL